MLKQYNEYFVLICTQTQIIISMHMPYMNIQNDYLEGLQDIGFFYYLFCTTILHITMLVYFLLIVTTKSTSHPVFCKCPRVEHRVPI